MNARDVKAGEALLETSAEPLGDPWRTAVEEMPMTGTLAALTEREHEIGTVDA